jgi:serine/threonine protein kinase
MPSLAWVALGGNPLCAETENEEVMKSIPWNSLQCLELLGQGASGMIHRAVWRQAGGTERHVAVKIFKGGLTSDGFPLSELTASLAAGRHQNLAATIGRVSDHPQGCSALVMELIDPSFVNLAGPPSLETITRDIYPKNLRFHLAAVGRTLLGVAEAAAHLHGRGILHGDLYAHNILWQADRHHALLGDFGAASLHDLRRDHALALQRVEVRAFGLLLDELLERCDETKSGATWRLFQELRRACLAANPMERPLFQEIVAIVSRG